jgi:DNA-binding transcriptional MerR regulator
VIKQDERLYTIEEICKELNKSGYKDFNSHNLRNLEKVFNAVFDINGDEYLNRIYTESDLDKLITFLSSNHHELNYDSIRNMLIKMPGSDYEAEDRESSEECASGIQVVEEKGTVTSRSIEDLKEFMIGIVSSSLQSTVVPELKDLKKDLIELKLQNMDLKASLEKQQEEHYRQIDSKLTKWREESFNRKKPWYQKLLR